MDILKKHWGIVLVILLFSSVFFESHLSFYFYAIIILAGVYKGFYDLMQLRKMKIVEAIIVDATPINNDITDKNVNFSLKIRLSLENLEHRTMNIEALLFKKMKPNDKIKVLIHAKNIEQSKMFTGHEVVSAWMQIIVLTIFLAYLIFEHFKQ